MDIYSSNKKARHAKEKTKAVRGKTKTKSVNDSNDIVSSSKRSKKGKSLFGKNKKLAIALIVVASVLAALLIAMVIWGVYQFVTLKSAAGKSHDNEFNNDDYISSVQQKDEKIYNIALFGIDTRDPESYKGLSDSMMILSIDTKEKDIKLISLMRDTLVPITHNGKTTYGKLNSAYSKGGAALAVKTINENFGLDISEYATVNFYGMADIIDEIGGIEIDVQEKEINASNGLNHNIREQASYLGVAPKLVTKAGKQTLTGIQAVAWARIRSVSTEEGVRDDYGRTDRQRDVMEALLNKALDRNILQYPDIAKTMLGYVTTSLDFDEMWHLATSVLSTGVKFSQTRVPQSDYVITSPKIQGVGSTVYFNLDFAKDIINAYIYDDIEQDEYLDTHEIVRKGWYTGPVVTPSNDPPPDTGTSSEVSSSGDTSSEIDSSDVTSSGDTSDITSSDEGSSSDISSGEETSSTNTSSTDASSADTSSTDITSSEAA